MTPDTIVTVAAALLGPLTGTYFGLRTALNGMREAVKRTAHAVEESSRANAAAVVELRDFARDSLTQLEEHRQESQRMNDELLRRFSSVENRLPAGER